MALVLTRKDHETVVIDIGGERIVVTVVRAVNGKARLAIDAAKEVRILRGELEPHDPVPAAGE